MVINFDWLPLFLYQNLLLSQIYFITPPQLQRYVDVGRNLLFRSLRI